jgi:hypothetical protein
MQTITQRFLPEIICAEHGIKDVFPCPWPDCPNGLKGENFRVDSIIKGQKSETYSRHQWKSPIKGAYYTWNQDGFPHWFSSAKTLWNEARRLDLVQKENVQTIYHYTSVDALVGIVESQSVWLTDYSYLNDKRELVHGVEIVSEVVNKLLRSTSSKEVQELLNTWLKSTTSGNQPRVCIASFSGDSDSLSQWRAYGSIAIGFKPQLIAIHTRATRLEAVHYNSSIQRKLVEVFINHLVQAYQADHVNNALERIEDVYHQFEQILEMVAFFKDRSFKDEQEYRLVYIEHSQLFKNDFLDRPPKRFRIKGNRLLPYVVSSELFPMLNSDPRELGICEIVLGPETDELLARGIREFLDANGMEKISLKASKVPYRT